MKKKNFFRNCNAGRMLLMIVCLAATFASPQRAWADDIVSVTIDGNTTNYNIVDNAMQAANAATSDVTVTLLADVTLLEDPQTFRYGYIRFTNTNPVTVGSETRPVMTTLNLNGHTLSSSRESSDCVIMVGNGSNVNHPSVTITDSKGVGKVENTASGYAIRNFGELHTNNIVINASKGIYNFNNAEAFIRGGNITTNSYCIENMGTIEVSGTKLTSSNNDAIKNNGIATIGEGVSFENCGQNGIWNYSGTLKMTALPTFTNSGGADIRLEKGGVIDFGTGLTAPTNPVSVKVVEYNNGMPVAAALPYAFTKGYKTAFIDSETGTTVDPTEVFTISGANTNIVLAGGEAIAYDTTKPLVAVNTASDGSITGLYAKDGTDAEALTAAVTAANAATGDVTVSLLGDVDLGATYVTFNNTNTVGSGDDERTVKITLDLNGKTITGSSYIYGYVVEIAAGADVTIIGGDNSTPASIINTGSNTSVISNEGTLAVTGIGISETYIGINNYQSGVVVVTNCNISGGNNGIANSGELTIGAGVTIKDFTTCGISNSGNLTLNAVPTFTDATNAQWDIVLADFEVSPYQPITLGTGLTKPTSPIRVKVMDYDDNNNKYVLAALPFVFTKGYAAAFTSGDPAKTVDPADVFTISGANIVLAGGEAVAYDTTKPLVAYNTASDGSLTGLYAQNGNDITTDAAALTKAFNALADGTTLTLCKDVNGGENCLYIDKGTADKPVTIDLNDYKITSKSDYSVLQIGEDGDTPPTVIIKNGTIENSHTETGRAITSYGNITLSDASIAGILAIYNGGALTVSGGTIEGKVGFAIYNDPTATSCTIGAATIKSDNNVGIRADSNVTFTAWPTFSGNSTDITLTGSAKIVLGDGFAVPATEFNKIKVSADGNAPLTITSGYAAHCKDDQSNVIDPTSVFAWSGGGNYILVLDDNEVVKKMPTVTVTLPAGLSTYYNNIGMRVVDSHADGVKMYALSAVSDNQVVLKEITRRAIPAYTPVIISNSGTAALACTFEVAATSAGEGDFVQMFYNDLGEADLAEAFKGTATNITAYEPANGATLYGLNGEAFVKIDGTPNIDAHRCWLEIPATASARTRTLTIVFDGSDTTGIRDVREVNAVRGAKDDTWYSLDGRKLDGKPKAKGLYIVNGKKMIIKK